LPLFAKDGILFCCPRTLALDDRRIS